MNRQLIKIHLLSMLYNLKFLAAFLGPFLIQYEKVSELGLSETSTTTLKIATA